jgi:hypothetical protein
VVDSNACVRPEDDPKEWAETCSLNRNNNKITKAIIANTRIYMLCFDLIYTSIIDRYTFNTVGMNKLKKFSCLQ